MLDDAGDVYSIKTTW